MLTLAIIMYAGLLILSIYNIYWFLLKQGHSQILFIRSFYTLATIIIFMRLCEFSMLLIPLLANDSTQTSEEYLVFSEAFDSLATYLTICVGLFQIVAMIVLTMQLRRADENKVKNYESRLYCGARVIAAIVTAAALADTLLSLFCVSK
jgi:hypothetical protein